MSKLSDTKVQTQTSIRILCFTLFMSLTLPSDGPVVPLVVVLPLTTEGFPAWRTGANYKKLKDSYEKSGSTQNPPTTKNSWLVDA